MGLDSVELVMEFEAFFNVEIPDIISEKLRTVQDVVGYISNQVKFIDTGNSIKALVYEQLSKELGAIGVIPTDLSKKIDGIIPCSDEEQWKEFASKSLYEIPLPFNQWKLVKYLDKLFPSTNIKYKDTTIDRFLDLVCAVNYKKLLTPSLVQNQYEILIGVMGMTINKLGVDPYDVFPESNFVNDLGLD